MCGSVLKRTGVSRVSVCGPLVSGGDIGSRVILTSLTVRIRQVARDGKERTSLGLFGSEDRSRGTRRDHEGTLGRTVSHKREEFVPFIVFRKSP